MPFVALGLSPSLCTPLARLGYTTPTPVQLKSIPIVLSGSDLLASAQTGTGKTAAFGLPMIDRLLVARRRRRRRAQAARPGARADARAGAAGPQVARDLRRARRTCASPPSSAASRSGRRRKALRHGTDIVVATPGRLLDHMEQRTVDLSGVQILTLDEADRMLDMGFLPPLRRILRGAAARSRRRCCSRRRSPDESSGSSADFTRDPQRVDVSEGQAVAADRDAPRASGRAISARAIC